MKVVQKRAPRSYKARQTPYVKATRRAKKENTTLAALIEELVTAYGNGMVITIYDDTGGVKFFDRNMQS